MSARVATRKWLLLACLAIIIACVQSLTLLKNSNPPLFLAVAGDHGVPNSFVVVLKLRTGNLLSLLNVLDLLGISLVHVYNLQTTILIVACPLLTIELFVQSSNLLGISLIAYIEQDLYFNNTRAFGPLNTPRTHEQTLPASALNTRSDSLPATQFAPLSLSSSLTYEYPAPWHLDRIDQSHLPLDGYYFFDSAAMGSGVDVFVMDTGIRTTHKEFAYHAGSGSTQGQSRADVVFSYFGARGSAQATGDCNGHGTAVASLVGGLVYGVAKGVSLHAVTVLDCDGLGSTSSLLAGLDHVTNNTTRPSLIVMSLAGASSTALNQAITYTVGKNIHVVASAGNQNADACTLSPAQVPSVITVGATANDDSRASFSNSGQCLMMFAPGVSVDCAWATSDIAVATLSGTSMSAPITAGVVAMILQRQSSINNTALQSLLSANDTTANVLFDVGQGSPNKLVYSIGAFGFAANFQLQPSQLSGSAQPFFSTGFGYPQQISSALPRAKVTMRKMTLFELVIAFVLSAIVRVCL